MTGHGRHWLLSSSPVLRVQMQHRHLHMGRPRIAEDRPNIIQPRVRVNGCCATAAGNCVKLKPMSNGIHHTFDFNCNQSPADKKISNQPDLARHFHQENPLTFSVVECAVDSKSGGLSWGWKTVQVNTSKSLRFTCIKVVRNQRPRGEECSLHSEGWWYWWRRKEVTT